MSAIQNYKLAKRYAKALHQAAKSAGTLSGVNEAMDGLYNSRDELAYFLHHAPTNQVLPTIATLIKGSTEMVSQFIALLDKKNRLSALPDILTAWKNLVDTRQLVEVTSAAPLDDATKGDLTKKLADTLSQEVQVKFFEDTALIGGLTIKVGSRLLDVSWQRQLTLLRQQLQNAA